MFSKAGVSHVRFFFISFHPVFGRRMFACSSESDCMPDNGISCFESGSVLQYFRVSNSPFATVETVQAVYIECSVLQAAP